MKIKTNTQFLLDSIVDQEFEEQSEYTKKDDFFNLFSVRQFLKSYDLSDEEIEAGLVDGAGDGGVDAAYIFVDNEYIREDEIEIDRYRRNVKIDFCIFQSKNKYGFEENVIQRWRELCSHLMRHEYDANIDIRKLYNSKITEVFERFKAIHTKLIRKTPILSIKLIYISKAEECHPNVRLKAEDFKIFIESLYPSSNVRVDFCTAQDIMEAYNKKIDEDFFLRFTENPIALSGVTSYIGSVKLVDYYDFLTNNDGKLQKHIFESNVRDYQGNTIVNKSIAETLCNRNAAEDFWWLNNGVTILASNAIQQTMKEIIIQRPEIVNGLQTSTEIFNYFSADPNRKENEKRTILVRLIVPKNIESRDKIIVANNSQTIIPKASLRATDDIHRQLETYFKSKGLYYDRRKNYYKNEGKSASVIVSLSFLAQCMMSIVLQRPNDARARPSTLLEHEETYVSIYSDKIPLQLYYNIAAFGMLVESILKKESPYNRTVVSDIIFYVMYACIAVQINKAVFCVNDLVNIQFSGFEKDYILAIATHVYNRYLELGGDDKVAKGTDLIVKLKEDVNASSFNVVENERVEA